MTFNWANDTLGILFYIICIQQLLFKNISKYSKWTVVSAPHCFCTTQSLRCDEICLDKAQLEVNTLNQILWNHLYSLDIYFCVFYGNCKEFKIPTFIFVILHFIYEFKCSMSNVVKPRNSVPTKLMISQYIQSYGILFTLADKAYFIISLFDPIEVLIYIIIIVLIVLSTVINSV